MTDTGHPYGGGLYGAGIYPGDASVLVGRSPTSYITTTRIWRSDIYRTKLEDITPSRAVAGMFTYNEDFDTKRRMTVEVRNPDALEDLRDWIVAEIEITTSTGDRFVIPLGHYVVTGREVYHGNTGRYGTISGEDATWLISQATMDTQYVVPLGTDTGAAARTILLQRGVPGELVNIPDSGILTTAEIVRDGGDRWWELVITLLAGGTMYQPWTALDMRITSSKVRDIQYAAANATYRTQDGAKIVPPVLNRPDKGRLRNRVTVRRTSPGEPTIGWTQDVTDRSSRLHPDNLAELMGSNVPLILGETYEEYAITSVDDARVLAESRLSEHGSFLDRLHIETYLDHTLDGHQILDLNIQDGPDNYHTGAWWQRTWTVNIRGKVVTVDRELTRSVSWR